MAGESPSLPVSFQTNSHREWTDRFGTPGRYPQEPFIINLVYVNWLLLSRLSSSSYPISVSIGFEIETGLGED